MAKLKRCTSCGEHKALTEFCKRTRSRDGLNDWCRVCKSIKDREYLLRPGNQERVRATTRAHRTKLTTIKKKREYFQWFHLVKQGSPCADCGKSFPFYTLDFDHRNGLLKVKNVGNLVDGSKKRLTEEMSKCDLVCANCHHIRTANRRPQRKRTPIYWEIYMQAKDSPCADCHRTFDPVCMEFDHKDPSTKSIGVASAVWCRSLDVLQAEIAKCEVVCRNCHRSRSHRDVDCLKDCVCDLTLKQAAKLLATLGR